MKSIEYFFWYCSGASISMLKRCPSESSKYVGIGATVFFTGLLAAISSSYAMHFVFEGYVLPIMFGTVWGLMIFNLDRFIVLSMRKSVGKWNEALQASPRFVLAILIALVISKPLEIKIFEKEINTELQLLKYEMVVAYKNGVNAQHEPSLDSMNRQIASLNQLTLSKQSKRDELIDLARQEADGTGGSGKVNPGPIYEIKRKNAALAQQEYDLIAAKNGAVIKLIQEQMETVEGQKVTQKNTFQIADMKGFSFQLTALNRLGDRYPTIYFANLFIVLLFITLEISPLLTKLISPSGPYDDLLYVHEHYFQMYKKEKVHSQTERVANLIFSKG